MKVSILVPIYNAEKFITRCAISIFEQTCTNIEYIFVNDCSKDNSMPILHEIIKKYPSRQKDIIIINNKKNQGIAEVRNILLKHATGNYIYFVDSDDYITPNAVETLLRKVSESNADIIRYNYFEVNNDGITNKVENKRFKTKEQLLSDAISSLSGVDSMWKLFIKRTLFLKNNLKFITGINGCEDYIMSVKLFYYSSNTIDINDTLYYYTIIGNNESMTKNFNQFSKDRMNAIAEVRKFIIENGIYEQYKQELFYRILMCKQCYLINKKFLNIPKYITTYPEANKTWRLMNYRNREKLLFWLAEHNMHALIKLYYFFT